jgi:hypothetical protein
MIGLLFHFYFPSESPVLNGLLLISSSLGVKSTGHVALPKNEYDVPLSRRANEKQRNILYFDRQTMTI